MEAEGFDLLCRCLKERQYAAIPALNVVKFAIENKIDCCEQFVNAGGFKYLFPYFVGRNVKKQNKRKIEDITIDTISTLCTQLYRSENKDYKLRLLNKFIESEGEKIDKTVELYVKYFNMLRLTDEKIDKDYKSMVESSGQDSESVLEVFSEENIELMRLDGGLYNLQQTAVIILFATIHNEDCRRKVTVKLSADDLDLSYVLDTVRGMLITIDSSNDTNSTAASSSSEEPTDSANSVDMVVRSTLVTWIAMLDTLLQSSEGIES